MNTNQKKPQFNTQGWGGQIGHKTNEENTRHNKKGLIRDSRGIALNQEEKNENNN